ncbi:MAG: hypothetical protein R3C45_04745 [Phycisphaerales bacterium]
MQAMIFFELVDIEQMLDQTHDPIADFINAVTADVIDFAAARQFNAFKRDTEKLSDLKSYLNLLSRAERIGYRINKVVYRGYEANRSCRPCTTTRSRLAQVCNFSPRRSVRPRNWRTLNSPARPSGLSSNGRLSVSRPSMNSG